MAQSAIGGARTWRSSEPMGAHHPYKHVSSRFKTIARPMLTLAWPHTMYPTSVFY
jgi:hypothetical protein